MVCFRAIGLIVATAFFALSGLTTPGYAENQPNSFVLSNKNSGGWWKAESRILVDGRSGKPVMRGLECITRHDRNMQNGKPPMEISITHPVESGEYKFLFQFNLPDTKLINKNVETITIGGRPYQRRIIQSRVVPWFGVYGPNDIILTYGIGRDMFRPSESYPWQPLEFLIPQFFEVEGIKLGISGEFEIEHGEYEKRYEELYIDMDGFKEALEWCYSQINPPGDDKVELPSELKKWLNEG